MIFIQTVCSLVELTFFQTIKYELSLRHFLKRYQSKRDVLLISFILCEGLKTLNNLKEKFCIVFLTFFLSNSIIKHDKVFEKALSYRIMHSSHNSNKNQEWIANGVQRFVNDQLFWWYINDFSSYHFLYDFLWNVPEWYANDRWKCDRKRLQLISKILLLDLWHCYCHDAIALMMLASDYDWLNEN